MASPFTHRMRGDIPLTCHLHYGPSIYRQELRCLCCINIRLRRL